MGKQNALKHRVKTSPNGRARKVYIAECPRCKQEIDLKPRKLEDGSTEQLFKAHRDPIVGAPCPMVDRTPEVAREWIAETRAVLGLAA